MASPGADVTSLRAALAAVERRLAVRARARAGVLAAAALALPAWMIGPGPIGAAAIAIGAALAAGLARPGGGRAAAWIDRHGVDDDLMISGAAAADGRVATALADEVVTAAGVRMTTTRRPSALPPAAGVLAIAGLTLAVGLAAGGAARPDGDRAGPDGAGRVLTPVGADEPGLGVRSPGGERGLPAGAVIVGGPRDDDRAAGPAGVGSGAAGGAAGGSADEPVYNDSAGGGRPGGDGRAPTATGTGPGAGDRAAWRPNPGVGTAPLVPAAPSGVLVTGAPRPGAAAAVAGVPVRYRALVAAYLAREGTP